MQPSSAMALSDFIRKKISDRLSAYCEARVPVHARDKVRLCFRIRGHEVVLFEERPAFHAPHEWSELPVAKFKYVATEDAWRLYCQHRDAKWHSYSEQPSARHFDELLDEVDSDPTGIFWG